MAPFPNPPTASATSVTPRVGAAATDARLIPASSSPPPIRSSAEWRRRSRPPISEPATMPPPQALTMKPYPASPAFSSSWLKATPATRVAAEKPIRSVAAVVVRITRSETSARMPSRRCMRIVPPDGATGTLGSARTATAAARNSPLTTR